MLPLFLSFHVSEREMLLASCSKYMYIYIYICVYIYIYAGNEWKDEKYIFLRDC